MGIDISKYAAMMALVALSAMAGWGNAQAAPASTPESPPPDTAVFIQRGMGEEINAVAIGLMRRGPWTFFGERLEVYGELSLSRWDAHTHAPTDTGTLVQLGLKPVARYTPLQGEVPVFVEFGVGLTVTSEVYRKNERQFSTPYNFGDHLALGIAFGPR
ncbi:MAG TPA: acyloxyacyl hydrolase, partial [Ideonella sp.]|nr:acyloxyacyl hydrolase [Ideonella sp.]